MTMPSPPTGLYTTTYRNSVEVRWVMNPETNIKGYNVYNTTTSGGGVSGYVKLNTTLIEEYSEVRENVVSTDSEITENGGKRTTVTVETIEDEFIFLYNHENLTEQTRQFYVVTAVNEGGEESPYSIEVDGTPLIISTELVEEPIRTQNDISLDYIASLLERVPLLDVKPGSVTRQLHIDPNAREISFVYVRRDFISRSQSYLSLNEIDDADGDRISDPVSSSSYKQLLKTAYFFETDDEVQAVIDSAYDKIAANSNTFRKEPTQSSGTATFYTELTPTVDILIPAGTKVSTVPSESLPAVKFTTLSDATLNISDLDTYYSGIRQRYEIHVPIQAVTAGANGNVNSGTVINSNVAGLRVTNLLATFGGTDTESNADLADRGILAFIGLDVGTASGYKKTVTKVPEVTDVQIVDAGHPMMQRDYDEVRKKHVFGKVDIYIRGGAPSQVQDTIGFLYTQHRDETMEIVDESDMRVKTNNSEVSASKPIFNVREVRNNTKGQNYDLTGNWTVRKNTVELVKTTEVTMNLELGRITFVSPLAFGDVINADYDYKVTVTGEIIIDPALGGEVNFSLNNSPLVKDTYTIYKNGTALVEVADYTINTLNGFLQLTQGLDPGDALTADYQYVASVVNETVVSSANGGEVNADVANQNLLESLLIESDGVTLDLEQTNVINSSIGMDSSDAIIATYRFRDESTHILLNQPADSVTSVESSVSGALTEGVNWKFNKIDDILLLGNSIKAERSVEISYANGVPVGDLLTTDEDIVLINNEFKELGSKGIDIGSIVVRDPDTNATYVRNVDYLLIDEEDDKNVQIARSSNSSIPNGTVSTVSYEYGELITITYNVNPLVLEVQEEIEDVRHVTADVLVKEVLAVDIDFDISVVIKRGSDPVIVSSDIRTAITNGVLRHRLGENIAQSDVIHVIEEVPNVESVLVPLNKMVKADGTQINREPITTQFALYQTSVVNSYTTGTNTLLHETLGSNAEDGFYGIFEDDRELILVTDANDVDSAAGQGFISSDGEIIVSTIEGDSPDAHSYTVSYVVNGETGAKDIVVDDLEHIAIGEIVITIAVAGQ